MKRSGARRVSLTLAIAAAAAVVLGVVGTLYGLGAPIRAANNGGVERVELQPVPEGPTVAYALSETDGPPRVKSLALIHRYIPEPLPPALLQWFCSQGGDLVITFGNGRKLTYGPCHRPASINHLWAETMYIDTAGACAPRCGPGGTPGP